MTRQRALLRLLREFDLVRGATEPQQAGRAWRRLQATSRQGLAAALLGALLRIQLERPLFLPWVLGLVLGALALD